MSREEFLEQSVTIDLLGSPVTLQVGYLYHRPETMEEITSQPQPWDSITIEFWMPSRRYVLQQRYFPARRYDSDEIPSNYMVMAALFSWDEHKGPFSRPAVKVENIMRNMAPGSLVMVETPEDDASWYCSGQSRKSFAQLSDDVEWIARCGCDDLPYPSCRIELYWPAQSQAGTIIVQKQRITEFEEIVATVLDLLDRERD